MQLSQQQIDYCMECGVCTGSCPVAMALEGFSPRQMIKRAMADPHGNILESPDLWACLSCSRCSDRCPVEIDFPGFIRRFRSRARDRGNLPRLSHHGMFQTMTQIQAAQIKNNQGAVGKNRVAWARESGKILETGDYFYFSGCIAQYDVAFQYLDLEMINTAKNNLTLLNKLGIEPVVSEQECCCGHDAYWNGDDDIVEILAKKNIEAIRASGVKTVIFGCPEGYSMFREVYAEKFGPLEFDLVHITEFLARQLPKLDLCFKAKTLDRVTFQDPCRLGRRSGIYEAPRELIRQVQGVELAEMEHHRENAICCGTTGWMECSSCSKLMQVQRLKEAQNAGAKAIVTACPKCQIHLTCATKNTDHDVEIIDLASFLTDHLA
ncbi:MAG: (Fe-S)-binding protein [Desulfobacter sp.]|nr:MAG: (Fe-S)-binding protein [Desulfobacter sp.]